MAASLLASRSMRRVRLRSRAIFDAPIIAPRASRIGETVSEIGIDVAVLVDPHRLKMIDPLPRDGRWPARDLPRLDGRAAQSFGIERPTISSSW